MSQLTEFPSSRKAWLCACLVWLLLLFFPWGEISTVQHNLYVAFITDMIRLGIALLLFVIPGALLFLLFSEKSDALLQSGGILPIGFTLSVLTIALIGLAGRILGFSFGLVKGVFAIGGLVEMLILMIYKPNLGFLHKSISGAFRGLVRNPPLILALALAALMTVNGTLLFVDDTTYLAYLTNWQHSTRLGFGNIVQAPGAVENVRFWLAMYPMGQALLSSLSGVPGLLLLGSYLELFLVPLAVITSYWFARILNLPRMTAGLAVLLQVSLYVWLVGEQQPVGTWFYNSMSEDKVSAVFLLSPVFFAFGLRFLQSPTRKRLVLLLLSGLALTLTHPVILFYSIVVLCGMALISWFIVRTSWSVLARLLLVCAVIILPFAAIRFSGLASSTPFDAESASTTYHIARYTNVVSNIFYGLNPSVLLFTQSVAGPLSGITLQLFRSIPIVIALLSGILAFRRLRQGQLYWYVFTCVMLVLFATLPYTGWILGFFASARLISRASWYSPVGLGAALLILAFVDWLRSRHFMDKAVLPVGMRRFPLVAVAMLAALVFVSPLLIRSVLISGVPAYFSQLDQYKQLAAIGSQIDRLTAAPVTNIALRYSDTQLLPAIAANTLLISFREERPYNGFNDAFSRDEIRARKSASSTIRSLDPSIPSAERCALIEKYDLKFVVAQPKKGSTFQGLVAPCREKLEVAFRTEDLVLMEFK